MLQLRSGDSRYADDHDCALWVVLGGKIFLRDVEEITPRIIAGALLVVAGTILMALAKT
jgi:hypothetical protein